MDKRKVIVVGDPNHVFPFGAADNMAKFGYEVEVAARYQYKDRPKFKYDVSYVATIDYEPKWMRIFLSILSNILIRLEKLYNFLFIKNKSKAHATDALIQCLSISNYLKQQSPIFVCVQQVFTFGLTAYFYKKSPVVLKPWGGDIYDVEQKSWITRIPIRVGLKSATIINPTGISAVDYLQDLYNLPESKFHPSLSFTGYEEIVEVMEKENISNLKSKYKLPEGSTVIMNPRRFQPKWGCYEALTAFIKLAKEKEDVYFVLIGGSGAQEHVAVAKKELAENNLQDRFLLFEEHISLYEFSELTYLSDIIVSVMHSSDMRSASIMNALISNTLPVLSVQDEYKKMVEMGFQTIFVDYSDIDEIAAACNRYLEDKEYVKLTKEKNKVFIENNTGNERIFSALHERILEEVRK